MDLREPAHAPRIVPVLGDLARPRLGLSDADFDRLAHTAQVIYHNGALVRLGRDCFRDRRRPRPSWADERVWQTGSRADLSRQVHWVYPYDRLKAINVVSTVDCLRLATSGPVLIPINFVSSTSVFDCDHYILRSERVREDDDLSGGTGLSVGYGP